MNIRVPADLRVRLRAAARRRGVSQSILVRSALEHAASSPPDLPGPMPAPVLEQGGRDTEFVCWLAASTRLPRPFVRMGIERGRVRVDGRECRDVTGGAWEAHEVTFDGRAV